MSAQVHFGGPIFDGTTLYAGQALYVRDGVVEGLGPDTALRQGYEECPLDGQVLSPGFVDLQVNGGGGVMLNDDPSVATLRTIAEANASIGTAHLLPTLITDTPKQVAATIDAVAQAVAEGVPGIAGLHLEGPHLDPLRKGAHDPALIRPMEQADLDLLLEAAKRVPVLKVTIAPASVTTEQVRALSDAGVLVSLGHADADYDTVLAYVKAGARCVTHLFNAMSQIGNRAPGLVGAALDCPDLSVGLIADGHHVHPASMAIALKAKRGPGEIFLVTDAMAPSGSDITEFTLNGRRIVRRDGRLTLPDGTLAGADLDFPTAIRVLCETAGAPLERALAMATSIPARLAGIGGGAGHLRPGDPARLTRLDPPVPGPDSR